MKGIGAKTAGALLAGGLTLEALPDSGRLTGAKGAAITAGWSDVLRWRELSRMRRDVPVTWQATGAVSPLLPKPADVVEKLGLW